MRTPYLDTTNTSTICHTRIEGKYEPVAKSSGGAETKRGRQVKDEPFSHFASDAEHCVEYCARSSCACVKCQLTKPV